MRGRSRSANGHGGSRRDVAYPPSLRARETELVIERRRAVEEHPSPPTDLVGVAVSGGGIRSATFALGFFQALAGTPLFRRIDYLSTVSGGSYFGAFFGALFSPRNQDPARSMTADGVAAELADPCSASNLWLRDNGRYLAPAGGGDVLAAGSSYVRSLIAIHVVLGVLILGAFSGAFVLRTGLPGSYERWLVAEAVHGVWPSPWLAVPVVVFVLFAVPLGWAFWLMPGQSGIFPLFWLSVPSAIVVAWLLGGDDWLLRVGVAMMSVLAATFALAALLVGYVTRPEHGRAATFGAIRRVARSRLTIWLTWALIAFGASLAFAIVDTAGQSLFAYLRHDTGKPWSLWTLLPAGIMSTLPIVARTLFQYAGSRSVVRPSVPVSVLAGIAATLIVGTHLTLVASAAHAIAWRFDVPAGDPARLMLGGSPGTVTEMTTVAAWSAGAAFLVCLVTSVLGGVSRSFLNLSTFQALYAARLTRAYLGASNRTRTADPKSRRLSDPVPGDDIPFAEYRPFACGGPLHLINVTLNETVVGETQTEYRDRKGLGMAVGPAGLSIGIRHHALWAPARPTAPRWLDRLRAWWSRPSAPEDERRNDSPTAAIEPLRDDPGRFYVFDGYVGPAEVEQLPLGSWVGISGAAVSTGLGYRTSVALSVLAGFFNIRLGYWWDSRVDPSKRPRATPTGGLVDLNGWLTAAFPVQLHLLDEWLSRFRGPNRRLWNLTDGGHFENTGAYELVRRRLPFIVLLDDGEDPDCRFTDLGNLVRKARVDFGAQVEFLDADELSALPEWIRSLLGPKAADALVPLAGLRPRERNPIGIRASSGYATVARITYDDAGDVAWLLVVKPTLRGDEPLDVLEYGRAHAAFPQESTADQFFDEAQWESYRRLGYHVGSRLFGRVETRA